jgi:NitT/TauT family transport system permease protein
MTTTESGRATTVAALRAGDIPGRGHGPTTGRRLAGRALRVLLPVVPIVVALLAWQLLTQYHVIAWIRFDKIPGPGDVASSLMAQLDSGQFYQNVLASLRRILAGFVLAAVSGVLIGMAVGRSRVAAALIRPLIEVTRPIPAIALVPRSCCSPPASRGSSSSPSSPRSSRWRSARSTR